MNVTSDMSTLGTVEPFDVCIIGSGFAGTILGILLVEQGIRVVMLESGFSLGRWLLDNRLKQLAMYTVSGDAGYRPERTKARALGGNSNFWTGRCERYHPSDFQNHAYTPPENPWPLGYRDLEGYYEKAEEILRVRATTLSAYAAPRRSPFPLRPKVSIASLKSLLARAGVTVDDSPTATPRRALRFFRLPHQLLPRFLSSPNALAISGATVTRLVTDGPSRRVVGAEAKALDGTTRIARARLFVVACGGIESPRLLLLSRSETHPEGIGNAHDRVGRGFNEHPNVNFYSSIRHSRDTMNPVHKVGRSHQFYDAFRADGLGGVLPVFIQSWVFPDHLVQPKLSMIPESLAALALRAFRPTLKIGALLEMFPNDGNRVTLSKDASDRFGNPLAHLHLSFSEQDRRLLDRTRELIRGILGRLGADGIDESDLTWARHHIGTCRMGDDPRTSVVDRNLQVHDCSNLYVSGCETFVTGAAVPPVMTIVALAHRLSEHITGRMRQEDFGPLVASGAVGAS
jgi:choline dehydrogenase-like flavoprotein